MPFEKSKKKEVLTKFSRHDRDTASPEVQIALLTERLSLLTDHLRVNIKDFHSRRGLLMLVGKRKRLLTYLGKKSPESYKKLITDLGIRK